MVRRPIGSLPVAQTRNRIAFAAYAKPAIQRAGGGFIVRRRDQQRGVSA
jgi:hypothetical protein